MKVVTLQVTLDLQTLEVIFVLLLLSPLLVFLIRWGILLVKRFLLFLRMERFAKEKGFPLLWHRNPLKSLFVRDGSWDFTLTTPEETYHVAILSARHRFREHSFVSPTGMDIYREFRFRRPHSYSPRNIKRQNVTVGISVQTVSLDLTRSIPSGEKKVLLFYPVAKIVSKQKHGKKEFLDSGSELFCHTFLFSLSAFLRQVSGEQNYIRITKPWEYQ